MYHLKHDWEDAKDISTPERKFMIYRFIEQKEREKEEMDKAKASAGKGKGK